MAKASFNLRSMTVDALLKLRDDIGTMLRQKSQELKKQLHRLEGRRWGSLRTGTSGSHPRRGVKVAPKYGGPHGETWAGRGGTPKWLTALMEEGHKPEEFLIAKPARSAAARKRFGAKRSARSRK